MTNSIDSGLLSPVRVGTQAEAMLTDECWLQAMIDAEAALAAAQADLGVTSTAAAETIAAAAKDHSIDVRTVALAARETANPVVGLIREFTRVVHEIDPTAAEFVHRGSTSQDIFDTAAMLLTKRALTHTSRQLGVLAEALAALASDHRSTVMAGRTLSMQAVPTTFGLKAAGWRSAILMARARVDALAEHGLPVSFGGAAGTLAGYLEHARGVRPLPHTFVADLTEAFATRTGLSAPTLPWHAQRTPIAEIGWVTALVAGSLGKLAVDVLTLARTEIGEVSEPAPQGRGVSSAMPHKRNPVLATLIRSAALQVPVLSTVLTQSLLSEDERSAGGWHAEWEVLRECLRLTGAAAETAVELCENLTVHQDRMAANLALLGGQLTTERIAVALTASLGKSAAKELVSQISEYALRHDVALEDAFLADPVVAAHLTGEAIKELLDPANYLGAADDLVDAHLNAGGSTSER